MTTLVHINEYNKDKQRLEKKMYVDNKILDVTGLVTTAVFNTRISVVENKIPDTNVLVTTTVLNTKINEAEKKIPDVKGLVKKTDYDAKVLLDTEKNILLLLIIINSQKKYLTQR